MRCLAILLTGMLGLGAGAAQQKQETVPSRLDKVSLCDPSNIALTGWLGNRVALNATNRLARVDLAPLLAGFRQKPGSHPWIGEHIGKWMHAATIAWSYTGDPVLKARLDEAASELIKAQEPDGYLGTYVPEKRFHLAQGSDWDVWSHKYCLMGLLTYYSYTGERTALDASRKAADLLLQTFGPGRKSILSAGTHVGMAATSVLEPMVLLYRHTGDPRYLHFCEYIVQSWEEPKGPDIYRALMDHGKVNKTANSKAYEMLSNLVGLCELARATGDAEWAEPAKRAWEDIVRSRLYLTGSASQAEHFHEDFHLPNGTAAHVAETCVTTTWIQLNSQLLRLTGEAKYGAELEKTFYNHLAAAQRPDGAQWCYFTSLEGVKPYGPGINCCVSSGPRGMAMIPGHAILIGTGVRSEIYINLFENFAAAAAIGGFQTRITQSVEVLSPTRLKATIEIQSPAGAEFGLRLRLPEWAEKVNFSSKSKLGRTKQEQGWWQTGMRKWGPAEMLVAEFQLKEPAINGTQGNQGLAALKWGPFVLAYDDALNPGLPGVSIALARSTRLELASPAAWTEPRFQAEVRSARSRKPRMVLFVPFADAGANGSRFRVWLPGPLSKPPVYTTHAADESRSREGNVTGSIIDQDKSSFVVTFDGRKAPEDWYSIDLVEPLLLKEVQFSHGKNFHDGGWFDTSESKPKVQVRSSPGAPWVTAGEISDYPATTAQHPGSLQEGQTFTAKLLQPQRAVAVRVMGKPACGDNPAQAFSSCAELRPVVD